MRERNVRNAGLLLTIVGVGAVVGVATLLRLAEPLSSHVVPAEDPFTHMALVREHLRDGSIDPLHAGGELYPPGMHAVVAALWSFGGGDLSLYARFLPVLFGAIGVLGLALLLYRHEGAVGAVVGSLAFAVMPEAVFRTTMLAPTALDLAILPFFFLAILETLRGRLAWVGVAAPLAVFLVFAHPWVLAIVGLTSLGFALLSLAVPWPARRGPALTREGLAAAVAVLGGGFGLAMATCWEGCGTGFQGLLLPLAGSPEALGAVVVAIALAPAALLLAVPRRVVDAVARLSQVRVPLVARVAASVVAAVLLLLVTLPALEKGMPEHVNLARMIGLPILALAVAALVLLPFVAGPAAHAGAALFAATFPFVLHNPLDSEFWPHRTVVFLGLAVALLAGVAAAGAARGVVAAARAYAARAPDRRVRARALAAGAVPALLVTAAAGGAVYAGTPDPYDGWYRLYHPCEYDALVELSTSLLAHPRAVVIVGSWQARLVVAAFAPESHRIWLKPGFYQSEEAREGDVLHFSRNAYPLAVVWEKYAAIETPGADPSFAEEAPWQPAGAWCEGQGIAGPRVKAWAMRPG
ncbi:MAG TPA: DUF6541 family protein [Candidatus Thermoplasmatota archaeon]|nr:DUF6541 family protein [Candidatus Thermoplasmatota archaeon]